MEPSSFCLLKPFTLKNVMSWAMQTLTQRLERPCLAMVSRKDWTASSASCLDRRVSWSGVLCSFRQSVARVWRYCILDDSDFVPSWRGGRAPLGAGVLAVPAPDTEIAVEPAPFMPLLGEALLNGVLDDPPGGSSSRLSRRPFKDETVRRPGGPVVSLVGYSMASNPLARQTP